MADPIDLEVLEAAGLTEVGSSDEWPSDAPYAPVYTVDPERLSALVADLAEAVRLLRRAEECLNDPHLPGTWGWDKDLRPIAEFLARLDSQPEEGAEHG